MMSLLYFACYISIDFKLLFYLLYYSVLLNSSNVSTFTLGNGMLCSTRKWLSSLTMKSALAMMAQSTNNHNAPHAVTVAFVR